MSDESNGVNHHAQPDGIGPSPDRRCITHGFVHGPSGCPEADPDALRLRNQRLEAVATAAAELVERIKVFPTEGSVTAPAIEMRRLREALAILGS